MQFFTKVQLKNAKKIVKYTGILAVFLVIRKADHTYKMLWRPLTWRSNSASEVDIFR